MVRVTWQAHPLCFTGLMGVLVIQGLLPLASALLMKTLFDLLSQSIFRRATPLLTQWIVLLLVAQAALIVTSFLLSPLNQYFNAELGRRLSLQFRTCIYQKFNSFVGLSYFEDPQFQNSIQMASISAQMSPLQSLAALTSLIQGTITVIAFLGVLIAFNPLLAVVVVGAALPHAYAQMRFGRQRFGVAFRNSPKERQADYYGQVLSIVTFAKEVRLFNLGEYFLKGFIQATRAIHSTQRAQQLLKVEQAARKAGIHDRLATFPHGYQSFLGRSLATEEVGIDLSGGEWQKIALSRMFMREAELLILDEPTASLDAQAEYELYAHFRTMMRGRTCLLITHRFSTVRMADSIVVIENGEVTESGTHNELIAQNGTYATLYTMQAEQYQ